MGCFDTVQVNCPNCDRLNSLQTKAGGCNLSTYRLNRFVTRDLPPMIAGGLASESIVCEECKSIIRFKVITTVEVCIEEDFDY